jgi:membrane protein
MGSKNMSILAEAIAFYAMLSLFPALAVLIAIYGLLANPASVQHQIAEIRVIMPGEAKNLITSYLQSLVRTSSRKLGIGLIVGLLISLWSARSGVVNLMEALNLVYEEEEKRGTIRYELVALMLTLAAIAVAIVALVLIAAVPAILNLISVGPAAKIIGEFAPWPILIVLVTVALAALYRFAPSRRQAKWRWVSWGGAIATVLWVVASVLFSFYVREFGSYDKSFGSLGAVVVLLTWFYLSAYAILLGAAFNAEMERQTARDTTIGAEKPMGRRGAKMADTVAEGQPG